MSTSATRRAGAVIGTLAALGLASGAAADGRSWSASGAGENVSATDCTSCDEDVGMLIQCRGAGKPADVSVPWVSIDRGPRGARSVVVITIDKVTFKRNARTAYSGLVGYHPTFKLTPDDPLIPAMQSGYSMTVAYLGAQNEIGLTGSRAALDTFRRRCGWVKSSDSSKDPGDGGTRKKGAGDPRPKTGGSGDAGPKDGGTKDRRASIKTVSYTCTDASTLLVKYDFSNAYAVALVSHSVMASDIVRKDVPLIETVAASGSRYSNGVYTLHVKAGDALLRSVDHAKVFRCKAK